MMLSHYQEGYEPAHGVQGEHPPAHAHVIGGGGETEITARGVPRPGSPPLTARQQAVVQEGAKVIRNRINRIGRYLKYIQEIEEVGEALE